MISLFLDEDSMNHAVVRALRNGGIDVVTTVEARREGLSDEEHLVFATSEGRAIYSANAKHFGEIHSRWLRGGLHHSGIILLTEQLTPIGAQIRGLLKLAQSMDAETMRDRLEYLSDWMR